MHIKPPEVVSVLKGLVEDGELLLADGRRISRHGDDFDDNIIPIHPNFSLWVLANRHMIRNVKNEVGKI